LVESGVQVHVLTQDPTNDFVNYDPSLEGVLDDSVEFFRAQAGTLFSSFVTKRTSISLGARVKTKSYGKAIYEILRDFFFFPDVNAEWRITWKQFRKDLSSLRFDAIISSSDSKTSHFVADAVLRSLKYDTFWLQIWGDPWSIDVSLGKIRRFQGLLNEKRLFMKADAIMFVSKPTLEFYREKYRNLSNRMSFIGRSYSKKQSYGLYEKKNKATRNSEDGLIELLYFGNINSKQRNIMPLLDAIVHFNLSHTNKLRLSVYGGCSHDILHLVSFRNDVRFLGSIPFAEILDFAYSSNSVLLFLGNRYGTQIPGKLFDYLGTTRPILALVEDRHDPVGSFIVSLKRCFVVDNKTDEIVRALDELVVHPDKYSLEPVAEFSPERTAMKVIEKIEELKKCD